MSAALDRIKEQVKTLSSEELLLLREWIDARIKLTEVEAKIKALGTKTDAPAAQQ